MGEKYWTTPCDAEIEYIWAESLLLSSWRRRSSSSVVMEFGVGDAVDAAVAAAGFSTIMRSIIVVVCGFFVATIATLGVSFSGGVF